MTLKSRLRFKNHSRSLETEPLDRSYTIVVVELFDVEYYCDFQMWVKTDIHVLCNAPSVYCRRRIRNVLVTVTVTVRGH